VAHENLLDREADAESRSDIIARIMEEPNQAATNNAASGEGEPYITQGLGSHFQSSSKDSAH
jgi:hypothetical protein